MITDKEIQEYYAGKANKDLHVWQSRRTLDWAIFAFVKSKPTFWESIFGVLDAKKDMYSMSEGRYEALIHFGLITSDRKKITAKGREYYDQVVSSNNVTPN